MRRIGSLLAAASALWGCVATPPLHQIAVDTNRLVDDTANDQLMLNVLRAKDRMPMHFTSFTALRGNLSVSGTAGLEVAVPGADTVTKTVDASGAVTSSSVVRGVATVTPKLEANVAANPNFDLAVYDTKQFEAGFLAPVKQSLIEYYLQNGWPQSFLTALFVSHVEINFADCVDMDYDFAARHTTDEDKAICKNDETVARTKKALGEKLYKDKHDFIIQNDPREEKFAQFLKYARMESRVSEDSQTPLIPLAQFGAGLTLADIEKLDGDKYDVVSNPKVPDPDRAGTKGSTISLMGPYVVRNDGGSRGIAFDLKELLTSGFNGEALRVKPDLVAALLAQCPDLAPKALELMGRASSVCQDANGKPLITMDVYLRSPEAILYYLGAYVRCDLDEEDQVARPCRPYTIGYDQGTGTRTKVIVIHRDYEPAGLFKVRHRGVPYTMPAPRYFNGVPDHRGSQALVLVEQLINLQKSADTLPVSSSLHIVP